MIGFFIQKTGGYHKARFDALHSTIGSGFCVFETRHAKNPYPWKSVEAPVFDRVVLNDAELSWSGIATLIGARGLDTVVCNGWSAHVDRRLAVVARLLGRNVLTFLDSTSLDRRRPVIVEALKRPFVSSYFSGAFCAGARSREYAISVGFPETSIAEGYDVVDNDHFARPRAAGNRALPDGPYFLAVTRFAPEKNLLALLDAYERHAIDRSGDAAWPLVLCGSGPLDAEIRASAAGLRAGTVVFPGFLAYDELPEVYQRAGCMILPSLSEPWGLVVNEALAAGTPVIVSDRCGCAPDLVFPGENGFAFSPTRPDELAALMEKVASMPEEQRRAMGRRGQEIVSKYSLENWVKNFLELVERVRARRGARR